MTPTLSSYFDDWKEAKKNGGSLGGRFVAVSRVSDMRGIMASDPAELGQRWSRR